MTTKRDDRITEGNGGNFLCPPEHPAHSWHVETDLRRRPENRGFVGLESAHDYEWISPETKSEVFRLLADWNYSKPSLEREDVRDWIYQVLGYFRSCYKNVLMEEPDCWNAPHLIVMQSWKPIEHFDDHAGVHLIRKYYPLYQPTQSDFDSAYWGTKQNDNT